MSRSRRSIEASQRCPYSGCVLTSRRRFALKVNAAVTAMTTSRPMHGAVDAADQFWDALPVGLRPLAVTVTAMAVDGLRARASDRVGIIFEQPENWTMVRSTVQLD